MYEVVEAGKSFGILHSLREDPCYSTCTAKGRVRAFAMSSEARRRGRGGLVTSGGKTIGLKGQDPPPPSIGQRREVTTRLVCEVTSGHH